MGDRVLAGIWVLLVVAIIGALIWASYLLVVPLLLGYLLSTILAPLVERLDRKGFSQSLSSLLVLGGMLTCLALVAWLAAPELSKQIGNFRSNSNTYITAIEGRLQGFSQFLSQLVPAQELAMAKASLLKKLSPQNSPFDSFQDLFGILPVLENTLLTFVVAYFLLSRGAEIRRSFMNIIPNRYFEMTLRLLYRVQTQTSDYVRGQSLDSLANAVLISGALWILGVPYSLVIGCFAGLANAIPLVGPLVGGLAAVLLCLLGATTTPWWLVAGVLFAIHMFDNLFIYPRTVGGSLDLPAWIVILGIAVGGQLAGVLGMLVAVPTIGLLRGFILELYASLKGYRIL